MLEAACTALRRVKRTAHSSLSTARGGAFRGTRGVLWTRRRYSLLTARAGAPQWGMNERPSRGASFPGQRMPGPRGEAYCGRVAASSLSTAHVGAPQWGMNERPSRGASFPGQRMPGPRGEAYCGRVAASSLSTAHAGALQWDSGEGPGRMGVTSRPGDARSAGRGTRSRCAIEVRRRWQ